MKKLTFASLILLLSFAATAAETLTWSIEGSDPIWGSYEGTLSLANSGNAQIATHQIRFKQRKFKNMPVDEVWPVPVIARAGQRLVNFNIRLSSHVTSVNDEQQIEQGDLQLSLNLPTDSRSQDWSINGRRETLRPIPGSKALLDVGSKTRIESADRPQGAVSAIARLVARKFYDLPVMREHLENPEFKRGLHFVLRDTVNYNFYQQKPGSLRIVGEWASDFSAMAEFLRYQAYAYSLTDKAQAQDVRMQEIMIDSFGLINHPHLDAQGNLEGHEGDLSSVLWTGIYVMSQSWRYEATRDAKALIDIRRSLRALLTLAEIHDDPKEFARSLRTVGDRWQDTEDSHWKLARPEYGQVEYHDRGNNDMLRGLVLGLLISHQSIPDLSANEKTRIINGLKRLVNSRIAQEKVSNELYVLGALAIVEKTPDNLRNFNAVYEKWRRSLGNITPAVKGSGIITDWSGNFLGVVADVLLEKVFSELKPDAIPALLERSFENWKDTKLLRPTPHTLFLAAMKVKYPQIKSDVAALVDDARWSLREMLREKPGIAFTIDQSKTTSFVPSPYPALFWKFFNREEGPGDERMLCLIAPPLFASVGADHMIWRLSPFAVENGAGIGQPRAGTDYLFAYWLGRRHGVLKSDE